MKGEKNVTGSLDQKIILVFLIVFLVSGSVLGYKWISSGQCEEVYFTVSATEFRAGIPIVFKDESRGAEKWSWDFGDDSGKEDLEDPVHVYDSEGEYPVKLTVNGLCERIEYITIMKRKVVLDSSKFPVFELPRAIRVGQKLRVEDQTENASTWEWRFGETTSVDADTKEAEYTFKEPGMKTVSLIVNGDLEYISRKRINVIPANNTEDYPEEEGYKKRELGWDLEALPDASDDDLLDELPEIGGDEAAEEEKVPFVDSAGFEAMLVKMIEEKIKPQAFKDYLCGNMHLTMVVNGKTTTFLEFTQKVIGKNINFKNVNLIRGSGSNCITTMTITYKKSIF